MWGIAAGRGPMQRSGDSEERVATRYGRCRRERQGKRLPLRWLDAAMARIARTGTASDTNRSKGRRATPGDVASPPVHPPIMPPL